MRARCVPRPNNADTPEEAERLAKALKVPVGELVE
jgi:hypothetical protein